VNCWRAPGGRGLGRPIVAGGPDGLFSTVPLAAALASLRRGGLPAEVSESAGTYACNLALYLALLGAPAGRLATFVHLPPTPESLPPGSGRRPTVELERLVAALRALVLDLAGS
jgi:pyroglutamyl-peptidase